MDIPLYTANDIKFRNVIPLITREYVSSKNDAGSLREPLCYKPLFVSHHLILLQMKTHFDPTGNVFGGVGITVVNTSCLLSECNSTSIASFNLIQPEC